LPAVAVDSYDVAMRYRLRTLLMVLALGPALLAGVAYVVRWLAYYLWLISQTPGTKGLS
jgi:hypothetical protein